MTIRIDTIELPNLFWENRFEWSGVEAEIEYAKAGNVHVFERKIQGMAIDLNGDAEGAWMEYSEIQALMNLINTAGAVYTLNLHGLEYNVRFRHEDFPVFSADPVLNKRPTESSGTETYNNIKIKLMEV